MSLLERVFELERRIDLARDAPARVEAERRPLLAAAARARAELEAFFAIEGKDAKREKELAKAVDDADQAAAGHWERRLAGARMQEGLAREQLRAFVQSNFAQIAAELVPVSRAAGERFVRARAELVEALQERHRVLDEWKPLLGPAGLGLEELPAADSTEPPLPRSLGGLMSEQAPVADG